MRFSQILRIAFSNLRSNKSRTALTIIGIGIGIGAIVFLVSLGYGLQRLTIQKIASIQAINTLDITPGKQSFAKLDSALITKIKSLQNVEKVSPTLMTGAKLNFNEKNTDLVVNLVDNDFYVLDGTKVSLGKLPSLDEEIVISSALIKATGMSNDEAITKEISLETKFIGTNKETIPVTDKYTIVGIIQDDASSFAYLSLKNFEKYLGAATNYNSFKVKVSDKNIISSLRKEIEDMGYTVNSLADTVSEVDNIFRIIQIVLAMFGVIALFVASIGMFNTMTIALLERTRDIGVMKAIGVFNMDIGKIFLTESVIISGLGGLLGTLGGAAMGYGLNFLINILAKSVGGEGQTMFYVPIWFAGGIIAFSILVGLSTGLYPSRRAVKLNPLDALRYE